MNNSGNRERIIILIEGELRGLWLSIGKLLASEYDIVIVTSNSYSRKIINESVPNVFSSVELREDYYKKLDECKIEQSFTIKEALIREKKYGEPFSMIISYDRALGKGYIFNADKHPDMMKSWWSHEKKTKEILKRFLFWEYIVDKELPVLILGQHHKKELSLVTRYNNIKYLSLERGRYGSRMFWGEDAYGQNSSFVEKIKQNIKKYSSVEEFTRIDNIQAHGAKYKDSKNRYDYYNAFKIAILRIPNELLKLITGYYGKNQSYRFLGWYPSIFRKPFIYRYFKEYGKKPSDLQGYRIVYLPLHLEPEISLFISPEFNNSMELIAWVSKSLPVDTLLVVKEQPYSYGIRSKHYYDNLRRIGNVVLAYPEIPSLEWIRNSEFVTTITGTVGVEAIYFEKPVLSFGKHQIINLLPTVRYVNNYESTLKGVNELLSLPKDDRLFKVSKEAYVHSLSDISFEMPGIGEIYKSRELHLDLAARATRSLKEQYDV